MLKRKVNQIVEKNIIVPKNAMIEKNIIVPKKCND